MGMLDQNTKLATAQAVTNMGDTPSTNTYDAGSAHAADIGLADFVWLEATVDTKATSGGAATVAVVLQHSDDNATWADALTGTAVPVAQCTQGAALLQTKLPAGLKRYTRVVWRVGAAALTAGKFNAYYCMDVQRNISRPSAYTVV